MKFLHISDLHIGKSVNGFSMLGEQKHALGQIIEYLRAERPSVVVIAGDVYDRAVPGVDAVQVFDDFLTALAGEEVVVLLISGNHDSPERLNYASRLLTDKRLFLYGAFDGTLRKHTLADEHGDLNFWLLPFIKPSSVRGFFGDQRIETYGDALAAALDSAGIDYAERNILVSHQFYVKAGVSPIRSESELNPVGGLDAVDAGRIENFDYAALGHLHGAQTVGGENLRYAGSPIKYSLSEWRHEKSVTLVELGKKGALTVRALPLSPLHDMREIKGELAVLTSDEVSSLADREDYLRVILTDEEEIIDPMGKLRSVYPNIMSIDFENAHTRVDTGAIFTDAETIEKLSPFDLFSEFFLNTQGSTMSEEQSEIVRELLDEEGER
ncbi:MAG: exonuclease SbcCD subunit D [Candidatus Accumulibacter sp.]|nr:exonuclease SbcCD subunit D [Accumulibacter sp.]